MLMHELDDTGCPNYAGDIERGGEPIILDRMLHFDNTKKLYAFEVDDDGNLIEPTNITIEGRFYDETDAEYQDLIAGAELGGASTYERFLVRIEASAGSSVIDKFITLRSLT
jgi:hypothetical protein